MKILFMLTILLSTASAKTNFSDCQKNLSKFLKVKDLAKPFYSLVGIYLDKEIDEYYACRLEIKMDDSRDDWINFDNRLQLSSGYWDLMSSGYVANDKVNDLTKHKINECRYNKKKREFRIEVQDSSHCRDTYILTLKVNERGEFISSRIVDREKKKWPKVFCTNRTIDTLCQFPGKRVYMPDLL
jgi:hypothetical protein